MRIPLLFILLYTFILPIFGAPHPVGVATPANPRARDGPASLLGTRISNVRGNDDTQGRIKAAHAKQAFARLSSGASLNARAGDSNDEKHRVLRYATRRAIHTHAVPDARGGGRRRDRAKVVGEAKKRRLEAAHAQVARGPYLERQVQTATPDPLPPLSTALEGGGPTEVTPDPLPPLSTTIGTGPGSEETKKR